MSTRQPVLRFGVIIGALNVTDQTCVVQLIDRTDGRTFKCTIPHPMASTGWGIFAVPTIGTRVMIDFLQGERPQIVGVVPINQYALDFSLPDNISNITVDEHEYPLMKPGEIALQSIAGSKLHMKADGSVVLAVDDISVFYDKSSVVSEKYDSQYVNTEAFRFISSPIKRDLRETPSSSENSFEKLISIDADKPLSVIGRNSAIPTASLTAGIQTSHETTRNPSLIENRSLVYEFARSHMVGTFAEEKDRMDDIGSQFLSQNGRRDMGRTDILNLGLHLPNNLLETISGTVVDIYGNVLDINRNIINFNNLTTNLKDPNRILNEEALLRRSIKYHFELNARKSTLAEQASNTLDSVDPTDEATANGYTHSRLSFDIDGEGFIKLNIPASSNTGNIPLLSRYVNQHSDDPLKRNNWDFRSKNRKDIDHIAFGNLEGNGIDVSDIYKPENIGSDARDFKYRTAFHDIGDTASEIVVSPVSSTIDNTLNSSGSNAGGRSLHANLDGSLELNIGRDVVDKKSIVIDTAGSVISRIGSDINGNSVVSQLDGDVSVQVGGDSVRGEDVAETNSFKIYVKGASGFHKIEITGDSITVNSAPNSNMVFQSERNLILSAKGQVIVNGETVAMYGTYDDNGNSVVGERLVLRNGVEI